MELILLYGALLSILAISLYYLSTFKTSTKSRLPPGKMGWPLIGESLEFLSNLENLNLEKFSLKRMVKYSADVFKTSVLGDHVAVLCGAAGSKFLFSKGNKSVEKRPARPALLLFGSGGGPVTFHRQIKPEFLRFVKHDGLKNFVGVMDAMAQHHLESRWHGVQVITVYPSVKRYAFALACRLLMSIEDPDVVESLFDPMETLASGLLSMPIDLPGTRMNRALKAADTLRSQIQQIVRHQRSMDDKNTFLSYVLPACEDDKDVANGILALLLAGHDPLTSVICMIFNVMANDPDVYRRVYEENMEIGRQEELLNLEDSHKMRYTWNVAREVMRLYSPTPFLTREAMTDLTYAGYHIPKGYKLMLNIHATHKDPKYFPEPQKFDPSRFDGEGPLPYTYFPFGGGLSLCPGMNYAQLAILVFIHNAVKRFKWEKVIADEKIIGIPFPKPSQGFPIILHPHAR